MRLAAVQVDARLQDYMESLLPRRDPVVERIERQVEEQNIPAVGPLEGQLLYLLLKTHRSADVLELGTAVGYSAIWLARGCSGKVTTVELQAERAQQARQNLEDAGLGDRVQVVEGDAIGYLERTQDQVDCVFNDLLNSFPDEATVERCVQLSLARLRPGGLLLADNALGRGEVVRPSSRQSRNISRYNELVARAPQLESVIVPLRDGVSVARLKD
ncbi:MAG: O-methyltransferase [Candidatus Dormibacteraeota bacterium]|jgi:predicted O-methyltransferase YrrM|nr:O-methyltransferase [Candidatus Dormibacteraeota bacterium]